MEFFRRINRLALLLWSVLITLSLLSAQGVALHVHSFEHGSDESHVHGMDEVSDHAHLNQVHFTYDETHNDYHDGVVSEIDVSPEGLLKSFNNVLAIVLVAFIVSVVMLSTARLLLCRYRDSKLTVNKHYVLSPPLRAPPALNS